MCQKYLHSDAIMSMRKLCYEPSSRKKMDWWSSHYSFGHKWPLIFYFGFRAGFQSELVYVDDKAGVV